MIELFRGSFEFLSNYYPAPVFWEGQWYQSSEAAYQASKTLAPLIRKQFEHLTPDESKKLGRKISVRKGWDDIKADVMRAIVHTKFTQHPELAKLLIDTAPQELVEGNYWHDNFFGDCKCPSCRETVGQNHLGRILMEERNRLMEVLE